MSHSTIAHQEDELDGDTHLTGISASKRFTVGIQVFKLQQPKITKLCNSFVRSIRGNDQLQKTPEVKAEANVDSAMQGLAPDGPG